MSSVAHCTLHRAFWRPGCLCFDWRCLLSLQCISDTALENKHAHAHLHAQMDTTETQPFFFLINLVLSSSEAPDSCLSQVQCWCGIICSLFLFLSPLPPPFSLSFCMLPVVCSLKLFAWICVMFPTWGEDTVGHEIHVYKTNVAAMCVVWHALSCPGVSKRDHPEVG